MWFVPLSKRGRVDHNYAIFHESFGTDKLVITGIVYYIDNACLSGAVLTTPCKITMVQSKSTSLDISTSNTNSPNSSDTDLMIESKP